MKKIDPLIIKNIDIGINISEVINLFSNSLIIKYSQNFF